MYIPVKNTKRKMYFLNEMVLNIILAIDIVIGKNIFIRNFIYSFF